MYAPSLERVLTDSTRLYAERVRDGDILAGRGVRLACERHLKDLDRVGWDKTFPYYFNEEIAGNAIQFFPTFLKLEEGDPFVLAGWQEFVTGSIFGWVHDGDDMRRFRHAYIETGKGSGKTPWLAGVGLYGLVVDQEPAAEIYSAATQRDQAMIMLRDAIRMAGDSEDLREILGIGRYNLSIDETHSFFRTVSAEHRGLDGKRPHMALVDELHEHKDGTVSRKMKAGFKRRRQPIEIDITNSGHDVQSICWEHHQRSLDVCEGAIADEQWFGYVCHLDPCDDCFSKGYRQPRDGCASCDDWTDLAVAPKANPSLGITIDLDYLQTQIDDALTTPSSQALIKRLNFCIWTQTHQIWIAPDDWRACAVPEVVAENSLRHACTAGLDLSAKLDLTACVLAVRVPDDPARGEEEVSIKGTDDHGQPVVRKFTLNYHVDLIPFFWLPEDTLVERVKEERIPYDVWRTTGALQVTPGGVIDYDLIYDTIVDDLSKRFRIAKLGYDPREATMLAVELRDKGKIDVAEIQQGRRLSEAYKLIEVLVRSRRLRHDGNEVLAWNFSNAERLEDKYENIWIEKPSGGKRIDGAVAAAMAIHQLMLIPQKRRRKIRASVHTASSVIPLRREREDHSEATE